MKKYKSIKVRKEDWKKIRDIAHETEKTMIDVISNLLK